MRKAESPDLCMQCMWQTIKSGQGILDNSCIMCVVVVHSPQHRAPLVLSFIILVFKMIYVPVLYLAAYMVPGSSLKHVFSHDICSDYLLLQFMYDCGSTCRRNRTSCWPSSWLSNCLRVTVLMNWAPPLSMTSTLKWIII